MAAPWETVNANEFGWRGELELMHEGEAGNISSYETLEFEFKPPRGALRVRDATFLTDGSDGIVCRIIAEGDIDAPGRWRVRARIRRVTPPADLRSRWHYFWAEA